MTVAAQTPRSSAMRSSVSPAVGAEQNLHPVALTQGQGAAVAPFQVTPLVVGQAHHVLLLHRAPPFGGIIELEGLITKKLPP